MPYKIDLTNQKYNRLTALSYIGQRNGRNGYWLCRCDCGKQVEVRGYSIRTGAVKSCGCYKEDVRRQLVNSRIAPNQAAINRVLKQYISNAVNRGYTFQLTKDEFMRLSQRNCHYCNTPPSNTKITPRGSFTYNGLDRVNNENGYTLDNVVTCCRTCNMLKQGMTYEKFVSHIKQIALHLSMVR